MFGLSPIEIGVIGIVAVLLFGSQLPKVARSLGQSVIELKRGFKAAVDDSPELDHK